ncbi:MAG: hypothetical protein ACLFQV_12295, partial [Vulcanimicrobiota bacterium]
MEENKDIFQIISNKWDIWDDCTGFEVYFNHEENCPYGDAVSSTISQGISLYREETVKMPMPDDVRVRLRKVIRQKWSISYKQIE